jgi:hypothetical protein
MIPGTALSLIVMQTLISIITTIAVALGPTHGGSSSAPHSAHNCSWYVGLSCSRFFELYCTLDPTGTNDH